MDLNRRAAALKLWANPEYREKQERYRQSEEFRNAARERARAHWSNPENRQYHSEAMKRAHGTK